MSEWISSTLGDLCGSGKGGIQTGPFGSQLHADEYSAHGVPVVMPQDLGNNVIDTAQIARVPEAVAERLARHRLVSGDIVFSRRGDVTRRALVRTENVGWMCGTGCLRVRPGHEVDPRFLSYRLGAPDVREWLLGNAVGTNMLNLNTAILSRLPLSIPELIEQQAIAEVLGALDDKIAANAVLADTAERLAIAEVGTLRATAPLSEIASLRKAQVNPTALEDERLEHFSLPAFDLDRRPRIESAANIKSSKFTITAPSVLLSKLNPRFPRVWRARPSSTAMAIASTEFLVLEPTETSPELLWAALSQPVVTRSLESQVSGTSGSHQRVKPGDALATTIHDVRTTPESLRLGVDAALQLADLTRSENATLATTRDTLLPHLMSGKIRVRDAEAAVSAAGA